MSPREVAYLDYIKKHPGCTTVDIACVFDFERRRVNQITMLLFEAGSILAERKARRKGTGDLLYAVTEAV